MSTLINVVKAAFLIALGLALAYYFMLPDPKGIGIFVLAVLFSILTTIAGVVVWFVFRHSRVRLIHYIIVISNMVNIAFPFFWMRGSVKVDTLVLLMLLNHIIGLVAGAESLLKILDSKAQKAK